MKTISLAIFLLLCFTVGVNIYALFSPEKDGYVFWCNIVTRSALLAMMVLVVFRKKQVQKLQQSFIDRFFSRN